MLLLLAHLWLLAAAHPPELRQVPTSKPLVALTVNVVWGSEHLQPMIDALRASGSRATFFLGGQWAAARPDLARMIKDAGMEIGSHGDAHAHVAQLGVEGNLREIDLADEKIFAATGVHPKLYAPAYGELSPAVHEAAAERGVRVVMWSIDTIDWRTWHTKEIIQSRVLQRLRPGAIVLMHPTDRTAAALPGLLQELKRRGYRVVAVGDLLREAAGRKVPAGERRGMSGHSAIA